MIKFFRKIRQNLLLEGKKGKFLKYAFGEIILVVIGILIALQINNWNENKKTRSQELVLLENLKLEMEENHKLLVDYLETKETAIDDLTMVLSFTDPDLQEKKEDSLDFRISKIFNITNFRPEIMVLKAAQNSNSIELIRNQQIKTGLSKWEQLLNGLIEFDDYGSEHFNTSVIPLVSNHFPFANIKFNRSNGRNQNQSKHKDETEKLFRSRDFENMIFRLRNFEKIRANKAKELKAHTLDLIQFLNNELKTE